MRVEDVKVVKVVVDDSHHIGRPSGGVQFFDEDNFIYALEFTNSGNASKQFLLYSS